MLLLLIVIWFRSLSRARSLIRAFLIWLLQFFSFALNFLMWEQLSLSFSNSISWAWLSHRLAQTLWKWIFVFVSLNDLEWLSKRHLGFTQHHISQISTVSSAVWFLIGFICWLFGAFSASFGSIQTSSWTLGFESLSLLFITSWMVLVWVWLNSILTLWCRFALFQFLSDEWLYIWLWLSGLDFVVLDCFSEMKIAWELWYLQMRSWCCSPSARRTACVKSRIY